MPKLTDKQSMFVKEYIIDLNATQAAIRAGYSEDSAKEIGCENLTKPNIQEAIQEEMNKRSERVEITSDYVLGKIKSDVQRNSDEENYNSVNLLKGCELLGRHLKLFTDKVQHSGNVGFTDLSEAELQRKIKHLENLREQGLND